MQGLNLTNQLVNLLLLAMDYTQHIIKAIASQQSSTVTQLCFNLTPKQHSSMHPEPDERPLIPGLIIIIINNYKRIIIPNDSLKQAHPIVVAQAELQPKNQMRAAIPFGLSHVCRAQMRIPCAKHYKRQ